MLPTLVPISGRDGELDLTDNEAALLVWHERSDDRPASRTSEGTRRVHRHLAHETGFDVEVPDPDPDLVRSGDETSPGFVEIDLVGHEGGNSHGEFCFTLTMVDVATGWTVNRSVPNKAAAHVADAIEHASSRFPFPILGIDSDNGSEFINAHLLDYCEARKITFTRGRPGNKNDGCHVEQKNWTHVRGLVGYLRYDTEAELDLLNAEHWV
ncbi:MAG: transposase family protein [Microthrixaceae bacterium]|nr:transposase family protein [Microthrixaceae bacterium]